MTCTSKLGNFLVSYWQFSPFYECVRVTALVNKVIRELMATTHSKKQRTRPINTKSGSSHYHPRRAHTSRPLCQVDCNWIDPFLFFTYCAVDFTCYGFGLYVIDKVMRVLVEVSAREGTTEF